MLRSLRVNSRLRVYPNRLSSTDIIKLGLFILVRWQSKDVQHLWTSKLYYHLLCRAIDEGRVLVGVKAYHVAGFTRVRYRKYKYLEGVRIVWKPHKMQGTVTYPRSHTMNWQTTFRYICRNLLSYTAKTRETLERKWLLSESNLHTGL